MYHWGSMLFNIFMHLCTSAISLLGSIVSPDRFPAQIFCSNTTPEVNIHICD